MNHDKNKNYVILNDDNGELLKVDTDSPNLADIVNLIILNDEINIDQIRCETEINGFDKECFLEVIKVSILGIRKLLENNISLYDEIMKTIVTDPSVEEFYKNLTKEEQEQ